MGVYHYSKLTGVIAISCFLLAPAALAQAKKAPAGPPAAKVFTVSFNEGDTGGVPVTLAASLRETRQGAAVKQTEMEVCFAASGISRKLDIFRTALTQSEGAWRGKAVTVIDKSPVEIILRRSGRPDALNFAGEIRHKDGVIRFEQKDTSFYEQDSPADDNPVYDVFPSTSREISLNTISIVARPAAIPALVPVLRKHKVEMPSANLLTDCESLRTDVQNVIVEIDPARARALIDEAAAVPGVVKAGWTGGTTLIGDAIRFPSTGFVSNGALDKEKLLGAVSTAIASALGQTASGRSGDAANKGIDTFNFSGPSAALPNAGLLDTTEVKLLIAPEGLQSQEHLIIYIEDIETSLAEAGGSGGIKLTTSTGGEDADSDGGARKLIQLTLARSLKGEIWNEDKKVWAKQ